MSEEPIKIIAVIDRVTTMKDGGGKITLEFGNDSLTHVQEMQKIAANYNKAFVMVFAPFDKSEVISDNDEIEL